MSETQAEKEKEEEEKDTRFFEVMYVAMRRWLGRHWKVMAAAIFANFLVGATTGALPVFIQSSVDILFDPNSAVPPIFVSGAVFILLTSRAAATYFGNFLRVYAAQRITTSVQYDLIKHFLLTDYHVIGSQHSGAMVASFMNEARMVNGFIGGTLIILVRNWRHLDWCFFRDVLY